MDFSNPQFSSSSNEVFPLHAQEVLFMRAYNYSATKNYKLQIMAYNDFSGLVMYEASRSSTFGGFYKQTETIKLTKGQFQDKILKYKAGEYFGFEQLNSLYRAWENFPRSSTIRFIDF